MRQYFSTTLGVLLIFSPLSVLAQKKRAAAGSDKPMKARFIVEATFEENYTAAKDTPGEKFNHESKLKIELKTSRWVVIAKNDVGNVEFQDLPNPNPSQGAGGSGAVKFDAVFDAQSGSSKNHATKNFSGALTTENLSLSAPFLTELGEGFGFNLELHSRLTGICKQTLSDQNGSQNLSGCDNGAGMAVGFGDFGENTAGKAAETPNAADYSLRIELLPELYDINKLKASGEIKENDVFAMLRLERLNEAHRQKADAFGMPRWFGAVTKGNRQSGWQILFTGTKNHSANGALEGGKQEWTQKLTIKADIIPNAPVALINSKNISPVLAAFYLTLKEISEKHS